MNRETKISLLVALGFILVVGILLSEHVTSVTEPASAALSRAGDDIRRAIETPLEQPPVTSPNAKRHTGQSQSAPPAMTPRTPIVIREELNQPRPATAQGSVGPQIAQVSLGSPLSPPHIADLPADAPTPAMDDTPVSLVGPQVSAINDSRATDEIAAPATTDSAMHLQQFARQIGEELVRTGSKPADVPVGPQPAQPDHPSLKNVQNYVAQPGDSLSRLAARFLGASTPVNRAAIVQLNPSLQKDPDRVIVGQTYLIPSDPWAAAMQASGSQLPSAQDNTRISKPETGSTEVGKIALTNYTVAQGDTLWKIARDQLGSTAPATIAQIKQLNQNVLRDADTVKVGMKLKLPSKKPVPAN